jgi:hypothetical protein
MSVWVATLDKAVLAREAKRLKDDLALKEIINHILVAAYERIATVDPEKTADIIACQARIKFCSDLFVEFDRIINSGQPIKAKAAI